MLTLSANKIITADTCKRMLYYRYILEIKNQVKSSNLAFGSAIDTALMTYLLAITMGHQVHDLEAVFLEKWEEETDCEVEYTVTKTPKKLVEMGKKMVSLFPEAWENSDFSYREQEAYRDKEIARYVDEINEDNWDEWYELIRRCVETKSDDHATFPKFSEFLSRLSQEKPDLMLRVLDDLNE